MADVDNRQVPRKDRRGIAQDEILSPVENRPLFPGEVFRTQKTGTPPDGFRIDRCAHAHDPLRIELDLHGQSVAADLPHPDRFKGGAARVKRRPRLLLTGEKPRDLIGKEEASPSSGKTAYSLRLNSADIPSFIAMIQSPDE